mmetsp:Transcript_52912/g.128332  ORF Transcript_52912/g.128332 Transcript_52912/m.128332 type:complete len:486 (+) Transcript_52912:88-1545(+)
MTTTITSSTTRRRSSNNNNNNNHHHHQALVSQPVWMLLSVAVLSFALVSTDISNNSPSSNTGTGLTQQQHQSSSSFFFVDAQEDEDEEDTNDTDGDDTDNKDDDEEEEDLSYMDVLGEPAWTRLRPGWSLTVNDQCLYEFVFQFEHDTTLPVGESNFRDKCGFGDEDINGGKPFEAPEDGKIYHEARQMWERFPPYVWAATGFNHLSVDWHPCGILPDGYAEPQYAFSFFRVTPEFRAHTMTCKTLSEGQVIIPGDQVCDYNQDEPNGMNFFIVPGAYMNRDPVVNMPTSFKRPESGFGPVPHYGLRSWDQDDVPDSTREWKNVPVFMSTYAGDLSMWQARVPYKMVKGENDQFNSEHARYFHTTVQTLPDTWAVDYDVSDGVARFTMVGKSNLCRSDFERAQEAAGGPPIFPNYDDLFAQLNAIQNGGAGGDGSDGENGDGSDSDGANSDISGAADALVSRPASPLLQVLVLALVSMMSLPLLV